MVRKPPPHWASVRETPPPARRRGFARLAGAQIVRKTPPLRAQTPTPCRDNRQLAACERPIVRKPPPPRLAAARSQKARRSGRIRGSAGALKAARLAVIVRETPPPLGFRAENPTPRPPAIVRKPPPLRALSPTPRLIVR